ncbi:hypothetical protein WZ342_2308 [Enterococcus faecalis]|nr:hypothetical protein WZ342_2308 [Enterococcus faecalis]
MAFQLPQYCSTPLLFIQEGIFFSCYSCEDCSFFTGQAV